MEACAFVRSMRNPAATVCKFSSFVISLFEPKPVGRKKGAHDEDTRVSLARPVLSVAHYFQVPVEVANETLFQPYNTVYCFLFLYSFANCSDIGHPCTKAVFFFCDRNLRGRSCLSRQRRDMSITSKGRCLEKVILNLSVSLLKV